MKATILGPLWIACIAWPAFGQTPEAQPAFEAADVHVSAKTGNQFPRTGPVRGGRYEIKTATMLDLIRIAYGFDPDKILEGPNWLELDRFDIRAKVPPNSTPETQRLMLQALLRDRFQLAVHKDTRPVPTFALMVGKKPQLREAGGTGEGGCRPQAGSGSPRGGGGQLTMNGNPIVLGPGMTIEYRCRNVTMAEFVRALRGMIGVSLGANGSTVVDETGLTGKWDFDLRYSLPFVGPVLPNSGERIPLPEAVEKQLGLKLEQRPIPTPVLIVDKVNRKPAENPPGTAEALPPVPLPTEFEVATVKPSDPASRGGSFQMQPGGRLVAKGIPLSFLINRAFNTNNNDAFAGIPAFASADRYDITATVPSGDSAAGPMDMETVAPMLLALLKDRFKLAYHTEQRLVAAYSLVAVKPKMKKANPESRIFCRNILSPLGAPPGSRAMECQNITMAQFAERLQNVTPDLQSPVSDATGLEGGWDFTLTFSFRLPVMIPAARSGEAGPADAIPEASDPAEGYSIFEAVEKQLGLKLEKQKRPMPVIVIDHLEQKPTED